MPRLPVVHTLRLAQLPLVFDCPRFEPMAADDVEKCARCREVVHDLSALTETQVRRFLSRHAGRPVCVSVRVDRGGALVLRGSSRMLPAGVGLFALLAAAGCGGLYHEELDTPEVEVQAAYEHAVAPDDPAPVDDRSPPEIAAPTREPPVQPASGEPGLAPAPTSGCPVQRRPTRPEIGRPFVVYPTATIVMGMMVSATLSSKNTGDGYVGTRQALPAAGLRRERRGAWRRLHGR